jgi:hypothetical protein
MRRPHAILNLVERSAMHDRPIAPQDPPRLEGKHRAHIGIGRQGAMQIGRLCRVNAKATIVLAQPGRQEPIRFRQGGDARDPHFFDQPILQRVKQPFHAPLRLRRVSGDEFDAQFPQRSPKLAHGGHAGQLLLDARFSGRS